MKTLNLDGTWREMRCLALRHPSNEHPVNGHPPSWGCSCPYPMHTTAGWELSPAKGLNAALLHPLSQGFTAGNTSGGQWEWKQSPISLCIGYIRAANPDLQESLWGRSSHTEGRQCWRSCPAPAGAIGGWHQQRVCVERTVRWEKNTDSINSPGLSLR